MPIISEAFPLITKYKISVKGGKNELKQSLSAGNIVKKIVSLTLLKSSLST